MRDSYAQKCSKEDGASFIVCTVTNSLNNINFESDTTIKMITRFIILLFEFNLLFGSNEPNFCDKKKLWQSFDRFNKIEPGSLTKFTCFKGDNLSFTMGTNEPIIRADGEAPARRVYLKSFCIDQTEVSNLQFSQFVAETNYKTEVKIDC